MRPLLARLLSQLRPVGLFLSLVGVAGAFHAYNWRADQSQAWWLLVGALLVGAASMWRLPTQVPTPPQRAAARGLRMLFGVVVAVLGAAIWVWAVYALYTDWKGNFDRSWLGWVASAAVLGFGLDVLWGHPAPQPRPARRVRIMLLVFVGGVLALALVYRLGNLPEMPGPSGITQVEELQHGQWASLYLRGDRVRWEYVGHVWLAALGIWLGGPTMAAMRMPFAVVSALKVIPLFLWMRWTVGWAGALVGTALLAASSWDTILSRIPSNPNALVVAIAFALLTGPARRGRPSAYVWLGLLGGYILWEYIGYRPLTFFILGGAVVLSLLDRTVSWPVRLGRPMLTLVLIVSVVLSLFTQRLSGRFGIEYMDGWNRAKWTRSYYNEQNTWRKTIDTRLDRTRRALGLFFFWGDSSVARNLRPTRPLVDPFTATFALLGVAFALAHIRDPTIGLTLVGFAVTVAGTLIATGNFDVVRVGGAVPYVYALAGFGAAAVVAALRRAWRRVGVVLAVLACGAAVAFATYDNTRFLFEYWGSPIVRRAQRSNLAYFSGWLRRHVREGDRVVGIAPDQSHALMFNDAAWLRGREMPGTLTWDIQTALLDLADHPEPTTLVVSAGRGTQAVQSYLEWLIPGLQMQFEPDPLAADGEIAYAQLDKPPSELRKRLAATACRRVEGEYGIISTTGEEIARVGATVPFIDRTTWPQEVRRIAYVSEPKPSHILVTLRAVFTVQQPGPYEVMIDTFAGTAELRLDGQKVPGSAGQPVQLDATKHTLEVTGTFRGLMREPTLRLFWRGPDTNGEREIMPFYRIAVADPACQADAERELTEVSRGD